MSLPTPVPEALPSNHAIDADQAPLPARRLTMSRRRDSPAPRSPTWDRTVDVTVREEGVHGDGSMRVPGSEREDAIVERVLEMARRGATHPESHTYAAIISILNHRNKRQEGHADTFRQVVGALYLSRGNLITENDQNPLLRLPETIRRAIWAQVLDDNSRPLASGQGPRPVRLQPFNPHLRRLWLPDGFQSTEELFSSSEGALGTCFAMRTELLAYILTTHRFHLLFSPYTTAAVCPNLFHWIRTYGHLMRFVTIELDLSRLGLGSSPAAARLRTGARNVNEAMRYWVDIQVASRMGPINELVLLARRYHGIRPRDDTTNDSDDDKPRPYCSADVDYAAASPITQLQGKISTLRIVGFNSSTTNHLLSSLFPAVDLRASDGAQGRCFHVGVSEFWPMLQGQPSTHRDMLFDGVTRSEKPRRHHLTRTRAETRDPAQNGRLTRRQIIKLKERLEAYERRQTSREPNQRPEQDQSAAVLQASAPRLLRRSTTKIGSGSRELVASVSAGISAGSGASADLVRTILRKNSTSARAQECPDNISNPSQTSIQSAATAWASSTTVGGIQEQSGGEEDSHKIPGDVEQEHQPDGGPRRCGRTSMESVRSWTSGRLKILKVGEKGGITVTSRPCTDSSVPPVPPIPPTHGEGAAVIRRAGVAGGSGRRRSIQRLLGICSKVRAAARGSPRKTETRPRLAGIHVRGSSSARG